MTLRLLLDESADDRALRPRLIADGHTLVIPREAGLAGASDEAVFNYANEHELIIVTKNPKDFEPLCDRRPNHSGMLVIYQDNNPSRDMTAEDICRAIHNLVQAGLPFIGQIHTLDHWRY